MGSHKKSNHLEGVLISQSGTMRPSKKTGIHCKYIGQIKVHESTYSDTQKEKKKKGGDGFKQLINIERIE